jgi:predicted HAD superfamily Cof-like phosphohydrolase
VSEFAEATANRDIVEIADALADIVYVAYGAAITYGIDLDAVFDEVHRSNMTKLDDDGRPIYREDGKVIKSANFRPPDIRSVLLRQRPLPLESFGHERS